ncbi:chromosome replication initiation protein [Virgibacillus halodenitrificans]|uniref:replication initiation and membrane attachment family protein n=1 Tax=Virgibacillus halodenitrificans TaxID=1482 RepID=UPI001370ABBD|nr:DnaD domain protein [Virgibacillus halodenitrificans]MYL44832.1 chromosome replication initiation protein [Virgibacillus halodenitrificans]
MNYIGKILPVDGYFVELKNDLPTEYTLSLTHLYQPLIGIHAISLFQTLLNERMFTANTPQTHHTLMNYLNLPLDEVYRSRIKLEAIGLLKTYVSQSSQATIYTYQLQSPFSPAGFFNDAMLTQLLYHHIGEEKFSLLEKHFSKKKDRKTDVEVTATFNEVFQTFTPTMEGAPANQSLEEQEQQMTQLDFSWMENMLRQRMIPINRVLTKENRKLIMQMMNLYDLASFEVEKSVLWALSEDNILNQDEFKSACHDLFKTKNNQQSVRLTEKQNRKKTMRDRPLTKEEQLIYELETISPKQLLEDLSNGKQASEQDMKVIREVMTSQGLPAPVMNVLIHYVLLQSNMKLSKAYIETIASHWSRANLQTAKDAMEFAKKEKERYQGKQKSNKNNSYRNKSTEVIPDWFKDRNKKKSTEAEDIEDVDKQKEQEEIEALLRQYSVSNEK